MDSHQKKDELGESLINSIIEPNTDIMADIGEIGLDHILEDNLSEIATEIPVLKSAIALFKTGISIKNHFFLKKLLHFLSGVKQADQEIQKKLKEAYTDPQAKRDLGEQLLMIIDRVETFKKIDALVKIFAAFVKGKITHKEFNQYSHVLENIDLNNLDVLAGFYCSEIANLSIVYHYGNYSYNSSNQFVSFIDEGTIKTSSGEVKVHWREGHERANDHYFIQNFLNIGLVSLSYDKDSKNFMIDSIQQLIQELDGVLKQPKPSLSNLANNINSKLKFKANNIHDQFFGGISVNWFGIKFLEILEIICKTEPKN